VRYIPCITGIDAELEALKNQEFSKNVVPFIQLVKGKKSKTSELSLLDDFEELIKTKSENHFIVTVPRNYNLTKALKAPVESFFLRIEEEIDYHSKVLNKFSKYKNVTPTIEVNIEDYEYGDLKELRSKVNSKNGTYCYRVDAKKLSPIFNELSELISSKDILIYDHDTNDLFRKSIKKEHKLINKLKEDIGFKTVAIKQIYDDLTFSKLPDGLITDDHEANDCIDLEFYEEFSELGFDYFGDWAGIRSLPIYKGGRTYPGFITIELDGFEHHAFKGTALKPDSYEKVLLKNYLGSEHWNKLLTEDHKKSCYGCIMINKFKKKEVNPNHAMRWKIVMISHFIDTMDYKIENSLV